MINKRLMLWIVPALLLTSPLMGQSQIKIAPLPAHTISLVRWSQLLDSYQDRFIHSQLTWREFIYARTWVCPMFPPPAQVHLCNSSVVGTSEPDPDQFVVYNPDILFKGVCIPCLLDKDP